MLCIPEDRFEARRVEHCKVNSLSLVRFDRNDYRVPTQHAYRKVLAVGSLDFGKPFEAWNLPDAFTVLRRRLDPTAMPMVVASSLKS